MIRIHKVACVIVLLSWTNSAYALTGGQLAEVCGVSGVLTQSDDICFGYVVGMVDGIVWEKLAVNQQLVPKPGDPESGADLFKSRLRVYCPSAGVTNDQTLAVVKKELQNSPAQWHFPAAMLVTRALRQAFPCN